MLMKAELEMRLQWKDNNFQLRAEKPDLLGEWYKDDKEKCKLRKREQVAELKLLDALINKLRQFECRYNRSEGRVTSNIFTTCTRL